MNLSLMRAFCKYRRRKPIKAISAHAHCLIVKQIKPEHFSGYTHTHVLAYTGIYVCVWVGIERLSIFAQFRQARIFAELGWKANKKFQSNQKLIVPALSLSRSLSLCLSARLSACHLALTATIFLWACFGYCKLQKQNAFAHIAT